MKNFFAESDLKDKSDLFLEKLSTLPRIIDPQDQAEFTAWYLISWIRIWQPQWSAGKWDSCFVDAERYPNLSLLSQKRIKKISLNIQQILLRWFRQEVQLKLYHRPLTATEILDLQCDGGRCVSCVLPPIDLSLYVLGERDPFSFCVHDLFHAHHFFSDPHSLKAQMGFARWVRRALDHGVFDRLLQDSIFKKDFEYVYADMNAHPFHLVKYLRAKLDLQKHKVDPDQLWAQFMSVAPLAIDSQLYFKVNRPEETAAEALQISSWLTAMGH